MIKFIAIITLLVLAINLKPTQGYDSYNCNCLRATHHYYELPAECRR